MTEYPIIPENVNAIGCNNTKNKPWPINDSLTEICISEISFPELDTNVEIEWKRACDVWSESILKKNDVSRIKIDSSNFKGRSSNYFNSFVNCSGHLERYVPEGHYLWESISKSEEEGESDGVFFVKIHIDNKWRSLKVDDKIPCSVDSGEPMLPYLETKNDDESLQVTFWPSILFKAHQWLLSKYPSEKSNILSCFNNWWNLNLETVPKVQDITGPEINWSQLKFPKKNKFYFESWEAFHEAQTKYQGDDEASQALTEAEYEANQLIEEEKEKAAENTETVKTEEEEEEDLEQEYKPKRRRRVIVPFNSIAYNKAVQDQKTYLDQCVETLFNVASQFSLLQTQDEDVELECYVPTFKELRQNVEEARQREIMTLSHAKWEKCVLTLPKQSIFRTLDLSKKRICLSGVFIRNGLATDIPIRVSLSKLVDLPLTVLNLFPVADSYNSATMEDHWKWLDDTHWVRSSNAKCFAIAFEKLQSETDTTPDNESEPNVAAKPASSCQAYLQLAIDSGDNCDSTAVLKINELTWNLKESLVGLRDGAKSTVKIDRSMKTLQQDFNVDKIYLASFDAFCGGSITVICEDKTLKPVIMPLVEGYSRLQDSTSHRKSQTLRSRALAKSDMEIVGRFRIQSSGHSHACIVSCEDSKMDRFVRVMQVDVQTGKSSKLEGTRVYYPQARDQHDVVVIIEAPTDEELPPTTIQFEFISIGESNLDLSTVMAPGVSSLHEGKYLPNKNLILFRDYFENLDASISVKMWLEKPGLKYRLQLLRQDVALQQASGHLGAGDTIVCESEGDDSCAAEFHGIPSELGEGSRWILQGMIVNENLPSEYCSRLPYWDEVQIPSGIDAKSETLDEVVWKLLLTCGESSKTSVHRESLWETSVREIQQKWLAATPNRGSVTAELSKMYRDEEYTADASTTALYESHKATVSKIASRDENVAYKSSPLRIEDEEFVTAHYEQKCDRTSESLAEMKINTKSAHDEWLASVRAILTSI